ncbi:MAG: cytochrome c-type biogenesis protein CcmH [Gemmatimonadota bacterium]|nr:cytochrome c-type biogenesis protein CcmH [Gemmatimonadota bacterium]
MRWPLRNAIAALFFAAVQLGAQTVSRSPGRDSVIEDQTRALASQLRCPVCQGLSIEDSPSQLSQQMRDLVRDQLRTGKTPDEVKRYFVSKYGEWILLSPPAHGVNTLIYVLPLLVIVAGGVVIVLAVRRWTRAGGPEPHDVAEAPNSSAT